MNAAETRNVVRIILLLSFHFSLLIFSGEMSSKGRPFKIRPGKLLDQILVVSYFIVEIIFFAASILVGCKLCRAFPSSSRK